MPSCLQVSRPWVAMRAMPGDGADVATVPSEVLKNLVKHPLTDRGLQSFLADREKVCSADQLGAGQG